MSSAVYLELETQIDRDQWAEFCRTHGIRFSPNTVGQNVFYHGDTQITLGPDKGTLPMIGERADFDRAEPPHRAKTITVSTYWMGNLLGVADIAHAILGIFQAKKRCDQELSALMRE